MCVSAEVCCRLKVGEGQPSGTHPTPVTRPQEVHAGHYVIAMGSGTDYPTHLTYCLASGRYILGAALPIYN